MVPPIILVLSKGLKMVLFIPLRATQTIAVPSGNTLSGIMKYSDMAFYVLMKCLQIKKEGVAYKRRHLSLYVGFYLLNFINEGSITTHG